MSDTALAIRPHDPCPACGFPLERTAAEEPPAPAAPATDRCRRCPGAVFTGPGGRRIHPSEGIWLIDCLRGLINFFQAAIAVGTHREFFGQLKPKLFLNLVSVSILGAIGYWLLWPLCTTLADWANPAEGSIGQSVLWPHTGLRLSWLTVFVLALSGPLLHVMTGRMMDPLALTTERSSGVRPPPPADTGTSPPPPGVSAKHAPAPRTWFTELKDCIWMLGWATPTALLLAASPWTTPFAWLLLSLLNGIIWLGIPMRRRGYDLDERLRIAHHNSGFTVGFGIGYGLGHVVPLLNLLLLTPAAAVGATTGYYRCIKDRWTDLAPTESRSKAQQRDLTQRDLTQRVEATES